MNWSDLFDYAVFTTDHILSITIHIVKINLVPIAAVNLNTTVADFFAATDWRR